MKNKSTRHKELNTFKFLSFSERIGNIDIDVFHKVKHEYESQEETESFFYQTVEKWNILNLTQGYQTFRKVLKLNNFVTLPQVLLSKDVIVEALLQHLKKKDPLYLQPLLEIVIATAKDLQKEFYAYYPRFLEILIELLNTKNAEQLEWTFTCLAYLFKFLWRPLVKDINSVFNTVLPLLSDAKPEYINNFAAESFAFVARKVKDKKSFLNVLLKAVKSKQDGIAGCGKLLFQVVKGIDGHFHSCAETLLPFLFESLLDKNIMCNVLYEVLEQMVQNILLHIHPTKNDLFWNTILAVLNISLEKYESNQNHKVVEVSELLLKLIGQGIEYKQGVFLQQPTLILDILLKLLNKEYLPESTALTTTQIGILLLLSKRLKISQDQAYLLTRKLLAVPHKSVFLYFVDNISDYSSFDFLILSIFLKFCVKNNFDTECFHILIKLILKKAPLCGSGIKIDSWKKYPIDFKEYTPMIIDIIIKYITIEDFENINNFDNYFCGLVCLPHLVVQTSEETATLLKTKVLLLLDKLKNSEKDDYHIKCKKTMFLLENTVECMIHTLNSENFRDIFVDIINAILPLGKDRHCVSSLRILSLCISSLKQYNEVINYEFLMKVNVILEQNFTSPYHEVRLLTTYIYSLFENIEELQLKHSADPDVLSVDWKVFSICYHIESIDPHIETYRDQLQNLEKLNFDKPQMLMCNQTVFKTIPLRYLCGTLYMNFRLLWEPVMKIIATHANGIEVSIFWNVFGEELKSCSCNSEPSDDSLHNIDTQCTFLRDIFQASQQFKSKPDFVNYRILLWRSMAMFANVAEIKTRDTSELLLNFVEKEYFKTNSDSAYTCSIKQNSSDEILEDNIEHIVEDNEEKMISKDKLLTKKISTRILLSKLNVFAQIRSPMSMYREPELYKLYFDLLQHKDSNIQKLALDCIMTYKHKYLTPYKNHLYDLIDDKNFKHVLTTFRINRDSNDILPEHRDNLMPVLMQISFSKMNVKTGLRTGGKSSGQLRRNLVFRFLAGCQEDEMIIFLKKALKHYEQFIANDPIEIISSICEKTNLEQYLPPKRLQSTLNLLNVVFEQFGGLMGHDILAYLLNIIFIIGSFLKVAFDNVNDVHVGYLTTLKILRTACINILRNVFKIFDKFIWTNKQINAIFDLFVWPSLEKLNIESIHSPTPLLKLMLEWSSNPRYFSLLVKHKEGDINQYALDQITRLLINDKCHSVVINIVEDILEKLISLIPDEEDSQLVIPVDNVLPIQEYISTKVGLVDKLNYGSCILLPFVPTILEKIKKKLQSKSRNLTRKELFILSRISELVWEANISDSVLDLLLPVVLKKCNFSTPEDIILNYLTTIHNLIKNVEKPIIHLKQISPLFGEVNYSSCRKRLCEILETVSIKSEDSSFSNSTKMIIELNAWDQKWIDQPDFERRHTAFKTILNVVGAGSNIDLSLGILIIYNCYFFIRSEKDLALKENSSHVLRQLSVFLCRNYSKHIDYILNETLFPLIRNGIKDNSKDEVRNESITFLGYLARECPEKHAVLRDLHVFTNNVDLEVDVFENLVHLQLHRHARALLKLSQCLREQETTVNSRTLTQFILPLISYYLCKEKFLDKNTVIDASIEAIGTVCKMLPWHQYESVLTYYLDKLINRVDYQKQLVKLNVAILDAFHFDLSKATLDSNKEIEITNAINQENEEESLETNDEQKVEKENGENVGGIDDYINENIDFEEQEIENGGDEKINISDKVTILCKSTSTRVIRTIEVVLLPKLHKSLAEMTQHDTSHKINRKKVNYEREEEQLLRVPLSLALVKLLQQLPKNILDANISKVFLKICTFLKSRLESVRKVSRETLQKIMLTLGPSYLDKLLAEMKPLLNRGYQVHVLVFTVHGVLNCLKDIYKRNDIDNVLPTVLQLCTADLFGILSEEKEVSKIAVKVSEARNTKTYDTLQTIAQYITESCLLDLILPLKQILETSHSYKTIHKTEESLRYITLGLVDNEFIPLESLLKFAHGTSSESIPQLLPQKKENLTEIDSEKLMREKEDCLIIPKVPGNRTAYRQQNVKTSLQTNGHLLVEFGLRICHMMLKRDKLRNENFNILIDPFIAIFRNCLKSKHIKLSTLTLQCLTWVLKFELPSLKKNIKLITKDIFNILHKYAASGLSKGDNFDLVVSAFKASAVLVRDVKYYTVDTNQLKVLLLYVEQDIHDHDRQATAFNLLKAIIARKINVPEIHDVMHKLAELSITSELEHVRMQARAVFYQFIMDYPLGNTLENHVAFYLAQMSYELKYGRESAIEMIQTLINAFPLNVLKDHSGTFLISLGARLINDEEPECRKMVAQCLSSMLTKLPKQDRDPLFNMVLLWLKDKNVMHRQLAAQICGILVTVEKSDFEDRMKKLKPLILKQFGLNFSPGKFVKLHNEGHDNDSEENKKSKDHHLFQVLQLVLKLCANCPSFLKQNDVLENLSVHVQTLLSYPHDWVRLAASQFLGYILSTIDIDHLADLIASNKSDENGFLLNDPINALKSLTLDLCDQLQPGGIKSDLAEQVIKNLIFVAKVLQNVPVKTSENLGQLNLLWLTKRMRKIVNTEIVENSSSAILRTEVFKWIAGVVTALDVEKFSPVLHHLLAPIVRELVTDDEKHAPLRQLAKEVSNLIKKKIGMEEYTNTLSKLQQNLSVKRAERKRHRTQLAVTDPELFAKKKIKRHEKKKELRKRKIDERKGSKRIFKKRKLVDLESSELN